MRDLESVWRSATEDAAFSAQEQRLVARACLRDPGTSMLTALDETIRATLSLRGATGEKEGGR